MNVRVVLSVIASMFFAGCTTEPQLPREGMWRAVLTVPGGELPFFILMTDSNAVIINDREAIEIEDTYFERDSIVLDLASFNSTFRCRVNDSTLAGVLTMVKSKGIVQSIPFQASYGMAHRFFPMAPASSVSFSGRWDVLFQADDASESPAIGEFTQEGAAVRGTFLTPTGDYRYLSGEVKDSTMYLSTFDGGHAFLFHARMLNDGSLHGDFWSGTAWHESWRAVRNDLANLAESSTQTKLIRPDIFTFTFRSIDGADVTYPSEKYAGKVVLVVLAGSWCPNCHDAAAFLNDLYAEHAPVGLEIIGLMYERYTDFERAARQVERYKRKFTINYELLIAGISVKSEASKTLPMLNKVAAFPTTIFLNRKGEVSSIYTGFAGPGTGEHYERATSEIQRRVRDLLRVEKEG